MQTMLFEALVVNKMTSPREFLFYPNTPFNTLCNDSRILVLTWQIIYRCKWNKFSPLSNEHMFEHALILQKTLH
jgi:hypothetical protein